MTEYGHISNPILIISSKNYLFSRNFNNNFIKIQYRPHCQLDMRVVRSFSTENFLASDFMYAH